MVGSMDIICYSHLRWNFVYQRPQHLLSRLADHFRVLYIEEPIFGAERAYLDNLQNEDRVWVITPHLPDGLDDEEVVSQQNALLKNFLEYFQCKQFIAWYYTPMAINLNPSFKPSLIVYDCMDELSAFQNAPPLMRQREKELLQRADIVFTGGYSLYTAKKDAHPNVYAFPSSIDRKHFEKARAMNVEVSDQQSIPFPRIGFFGVIDERMDLQLLRALAEKQPHWHFIILGPVVKINPDTLPVLPNIHYLGQKTYKELPYYISKWDVAMMPFAINASTRFISPTKTPEYLAAGKPVVSTPIQDVIKSYGDRGLVAVAATADEFEAAIQQAIDMRERTKWMKAVDLALSENSWDSTVEDMLFHINALLEKGKNSGLKEKEDIYV